MTNVRWLVKGATGPKCTGATGVTGAIGRSGAFTQNCFGYWTGDQTPALTDTFENILIDAVAATAQCSGWTFSEITRAYSPTATGLYLVTYDVVVQLDEGEVASFRATLNGAEVVGSGVGVQVSTDDAEEVIQEVSRSFILEITATSQLLRFQVGTSSIGAGRGLVAGTGIATVSPSISVTITRLT